MTNIDPTNSNANVNQNSNIDQDSEDFEAMSKDAANNTQSEDSDDTLSDEEGSEIVINQIITDQTVRNMKQTQANIKEIFDDE